MLDVGDTVSLRFEVRDAAGELANPGSVDLTITLPDQTTVAPTITNPPAETGVFVHERAIDQFGRHVVYWQATTPDVAYGDVFNAADSSWASLVGLAETKNHLNIPPGETADDEELRGFILSASEVVEDIAGVLMRREFTETYSGGDRAILLRRRPVQSVTAVTIDGDLVDSGDYTASRSGILARRPGAWPRGNHNIEVTYLAGDAAVSAAALDGTKELIRINWRPQQGGNYGPFDGGGADDFGVPESAYLSGEIRLGFFVPNTVMQRLQPTRRGPHVA